MITGIKICGQISRILGLDILIGIDLYLFQPIVLHHRLSIWLVSACSIDRTRAGRRAGT